MYKNKKIVVVIPAWNEEVLIGKTIGSIPEFVDIVLVVDDASSDATAAKVLEKKATLITPSTHFDGKTRLLLLQHHKNQGVGAAIASGYKWCRDNNLDIAVVMAGDAQMDPADLPALLDPIASDNADYTKGNRLFTGEAWRTIPKIRYLGNSVLSFITKIASGYWHIADSQAGYTAINLRMLKLIDWDRTYTRYGCPNDYLVRLNIFNAIVRDVPVRPVYGIGEKSGINIVTVIPRISLLLVRLFIKRMVQKYIIRDFHPLVLFYCAGLALFVPGLLFGCSLLYHRIFTGPVQATSALFAVFLVTMGTLFGFFAMWFDMEANRYREQ
ncbi:MAG: ribonuclease BN [Candidatus Raymondbacteria bacterium RifOxyA12_full_50_37]|uniref:Ribonuclease BN n=1 Tax=Candidatus Raymondbacteria bacterium RIFOXYD12_FULL_49_13 TaxID=1817890 RepID=A0A1F7F4K0_UNCRA|nr:MAG: ribonuclease BN [Candidatus Raymondbacteria bacterium RifOxyA12_full_50_37]OGJ92230.1 MAG: ribonuclease BN [Candidatus Raymondbacteria bacterium RIFOXYA2_FULL_49_16]OGJ98556.1 MAG: ribonuclease BN [Candidatus Raymondbacteria bacterium RIFOXYC2_FULL_50_21]OGK01585.1 MAG: ribonuclease BN [Candidatus Raymondbacteria bacterium RIFOXYD12_FULL_49_13]OGP44225.1 MAG: ribonuclease BN [Candidatus Raymondbacteria bacterium RIFOXYB2_FULL_49_35]